MKITLLSIYMSLLLCACSNESGPNKSQFIYFPSKSGTISIPINTGNVPEIQKNILSKTESEDIRNYRETKNFYKNVIIEWFLLDSKVKNTKVNFCGLFFKSNIHCRKMNLYKFNNKNLQFSNWPFFFDKPVSGPDGSTNCESGLCFINGKIMIGLQYQDQEIILGIVKRQGKLISAASNISTTGISNSVISIYIIEKGKITNKSQVYYLMKMYKNSLELR